MTRYVPEGTVEFYWVTTLADYTAPTSTELNAGVDLTAFMAGDMVLPFGGQTADAADLSSRFNKTVPGDIGGDAGTFTIHKEKAAADDTAYTTLPQGTIGFIAVATRGLAAAGTWAIADVADIWPAEVIANEIVYARNTSLRAAVEVAITDVPEEDFALVA